MRKFITLFTLIFLPKSFHKTSKFKTRLTLSGGGAKGLAHIGVLKVLEKKELCLIIFQERAWEASSEVCTPLVTPPKI